MGDMADLVIEGEVCEGCGEEMGDGPGHPQLCEKCLEEGRTVRSEEDEIEELIGDVPYDPVAYLMTEVRCLTPQQLDEFLPKLEAWLVERKNRPSSAE